MIELILAILCSTMISFLMRLGDKHIRSNMAMFLANYLVCTLLSVLFYQTGGQPATAEGLPFAIGLGVVSGVFYLGTFIFLQTNIRINGVVLAALFMKLGVLVPTVMAMTVFHESPAVMQIFGILLALAAIVMINGGPAGENRADRRKALLLISLLLMGGFTDSLSNIFDKCGVLAQKDLYLICTFATAGLLCLGIAVWKKQKPSLWEFGLGALIGIPNYFTSRFLLMALRQLKAVIVYPVYNVGAILLIGLLGVVFFKETLSRRKQAGFLCIVAALILLNL